MDEDFEDVDQALQRVEEMTPIELIRHRAPLPEWSVKSPLKAQLTRVIIAIVQAQFATWSEGKSIEYYCGHAQRLGQEVREWLYLLPPDPHTLHAFELVTHLDKLAAMLTTRTPDLDMYSDLIDEFLKYLHEAAEDYPDIGWPEGIPEPPSEPSPPA